MNYPTKHRTKAIVQTQCYVGVAFGMCDGSVRCGLEAVAQAHICGWSLALHKLWSLWYTLSAKLRGFQRGCACLRGGHNAT